MTLSVCFSAWTASIHFRPPRACSTRFSLFSRVITTSIALCFRSVASPWVRRLQLASAFGGEVRPSLNSRPFSDVPRCNRLEVGQSISTILDDGVASASLPDPVSQVHMLARCYPRHNRGAIFSRPFCLRVTESRLFRLVLGMAVQITSSLQLFHAFRPFGIIHEHPQVQRQASGAPRAFLLPSAHLPLAPSDGAAPRRHAVRLLTNFLFPPRLVQAARKRQRLCDDLHHSTPAFGTRTLELQ
ncbi:hypothetical protein BD626DRAFT_124880 [Schizophyllum amplum]|uniref:Uncharacterized protein n=1 Tax=Schizophyllum amplum TaxID=97359 RepID=A0A550C6S5_9AGAR|nr:hypothetical protein BD626DRAFT_124880 [Auriculariopsis ampla]